VSADTVSVITDLSVGNEVISSLIPDVTGRDLGSLSQRWDVFAEAIDADTIDTSDTITSAGLITALAGLTAGVNQDITLSGTGEIKHGAKDVPVLASEFNSFYDTTANEPGVINFANGQGFNSATTSGSQESRASVKLPVGAVVTRVQLYWDRGGTTGTGNSVVGLGDITDGSTSGSFNNTASGTGPATADTGVIALAITTTEALLIRAIFSSLGAADGRLKGALVTYTMP
jgi:hypothetical protein